MCHMNFRSCKYFLTVCEMGTINAAARKLYISQQSLSQHIRRMEDEVGAQLFHRDNPLVLTEAGKCVQRAAQTVLAALRKMDEELADCKGITPNELTIGLLDYGTPEFLPAIIDIFLKKEPDVLLQTREIMPGAPLPGDIPLFISARELGGSYQCEVILKDRLGVCVTDHLLQKTYGSDWFEHKARLRAGDFSALDGCPFVRHRNTPLQPLQDLAFERNGMEPNYLPIMGSISALAMMCTNGQAAMMELMRHAQQNLSLPDWYAVSNMPEEIPTGFICYRANTVLSAPAQHFLEITRRYFGSKNRKPKRKSTSMA